MINCYQKFLVPARELAPKRVCDVSVGHKVKKTIAIPQNLGIHFASLRQMGSQCRICEPHQCRICFLPEVCNSGVQ